MRWMQDFIKNLFHKNMNETAFDGFELLLVSFMFNDKWAFSVSSRRLALSWKGDVIALGEKIDPHHRIPEMIFSKFITVFRNNVDLDRTHHG
jgi:hypothetical protein